MRKQMKNFVFDLFGQERNSTMEEFLKIIISNLVENKDAIEINTIDKGKSVTFEVKVAQEDMGKVIGKQGRIAQAIRNVMKAVANKEHKKASVEFLG